MRRCSTDQSCNLKLCIMHRKIWVSCECNNKLDKYPFRSGSPWIRRCKRSGLDRCIYLRFCTGPSIWLEKIARFIFSYGGKSVKVSQTSNVQQLVGRKQNCQLYDVESTRSWVCKFFGTHVLCRTLRCIPPCRRTCRRCKFLRSCRWRDKTCRLHLKTL